MNYHASFQPPAPLIHVLVANMPSVLDELFEALIDQQPDMKLMGKIHGQVEILAAASRQIDVLLLCAPKVEPLPGICSHLLNEYPHLKILVLTTEGEQAAAYWLGLRQHYIQIISIQTLLNSIRQVYLLDST